MKLLKYFVAVAALTGALALTAEAHLDFLGAVGFDTQPNNNPDSNLAALGDFLGQDVSSFTLCGNFEDLEGDQNIDVMAGAFLVVHFGKGSGGTSTGGSLEFFQVVGGETNVTVPGFPNANDPFATGGISSIREFCPPTTPDSGTTAMLLGSALAGLGLLRRHLKR